MGKKKNNGLFIFGKNGAQYFDPEAVLNLYGGSAAWKKMTKTMYQIPTLKQVLERKLLDGAGPDAPGAKD